MVRITKHPIYSNKAFRTKDNDHIIGNVTRPPRIVKAVRKTGEKKAVPITYKGK